MSAKPVIVQAFVLFLFTAFCDALPAMHDNAGQLSSEPQQFSGCENAFALVARMHDFSQLQMYYNAYNALVWLTAGCIIGALLTYSLFQERIERELTSNAPTEKTSSGLLPISEKTSAH
ncbi:hypothetical protein IW138_005796 [Coemansia sp. RSA 986]|nr:hypothetical protein IW138_005796 [Coemansia sp. RSA 986]